MSNKYQRSSGILTPAVFQRSKEIVGVIAELVLTDRTLKAMSDVGIVAKRKHTGPRGDIGYQI